MKKNKGAGRQRKPGTGGKLALGIVTCLNLSLTLALALLRRRDVLRAVEDEQGKIKLLLETDRK